MKKRLLLVICCLLFLCGCKGEKQESTTKLDKIIIGSDTYPPFVYLDESGNPTGIDIEIATEAFKRMGYEAQFITIDWVKKTELVDSGEIDCIWGCFSIAGREDVYNWSDPYMVSTQGVAVNKSSDIYTLADLEGKTVAVQTTSKPEEIFLSKSDSRIPELKNVISTDSKSVQYAALNCGYVDAIASHISAIDQYIKDYNADFRILDETLFTTGIGVAFSKNDTRGLEKQLSEVFKKMREDGTMASIIGKYLDNPESYLEVESLEK